MQKDFKTIWGWLKPYKTLTFLSMKLQIQSGITNIYISRNNIQNQNKCGYFGFCAKLYDVKCLQVFS